MKNLVVHLGSHYQAELHYLTKVDWFADMLICKRAAHHLPPHLCRNTSAPWDYVGVDLNPERVALLEKEYADNPRMRFLTYCIWDESGIQISHNMDSAHPRNEREELESTHQTVSISLSDLLHEVGADQVDTLALFVNIEGSETRVFDAFDWRIRPAFVSVDSHSVEITSALLLKFLQQDYWLYDMVDSVTDPSRCLKFLCNSYWTEEFDKHAFKGLYNEY